MKTTLLLALAILAEQVIAAPTTKPATRPASDVPGVDMVVDPAGRTKYQTIAAALAAVDPGGRDRVVILIRAGTYHEHLAITRPCVTLRGEGRETTRIEYALTAGQWIDHPDTIGRGVLNVYGDDVVLEHLTVANSNTVHTHAFALYGRSTRTLTQDCAFLGEGNDTVGLWPQGGGMFYHANCRFRGQIDFLCPRGWCYVADSTFEEVTDKAALWHDGEKDPTKKFVLRNCRFDGDADFPVGRYPRDAQFYFVGCHFSAHAGNVIDTNAKDPAMRWGRRVYFADCHHDGGDQPWHADNLNAAAGSPKASDITPAWTFGGRWNPLREDAPTVAGWSIRGAERVVDLRLSEPVTVHGEPVLVTRRGQRLPWTGISGADVLSFAGLAKDDEPIGLDMNGGRIEASLATVRPRPLDPGWPTTRP